ncbi:MAG: rhamnulokinase [Bacteroidales bacterium]|nr:rhamnulokinase [Bacteroidales bacterium]
MKAFTCLAIDLGATSGRTILSTFDGEKVSMREVSRFANPMIPMGGHLFWDLPALYHEVLGALRQVAKEGVELSSIGVDTWGCDFAFFGKDGQLLSLPYCYRDSHTEGAQERYFKKHDKRELYERTGIQFMDFNSIFQLDTLRRGKCTALDAADKILFIPDALTYMLTGKAVCEYTVASTSQLLNPHTGELDRKLIRSVGLRRRRFRKMVQPGTVVGRLSEQVRAATGLDKVKLVAVAGHDTASAVAAVPASTPDYAYLSCGTWSLLGIESPRPVITAESYSGNFTNEGGVDGTTRFLKNICGLWLLEQVRGELSDAPSDIAALSALCEKSAFDGLLNPDDPSFAHPDSMKAAIDAYFSDRQEAGPACAADYVRCIFRSLARRYAEILERLKEFSPHPISCLHVIGGGSLNPYLMQYTADAIGLPVICGPAEGTALGNTLMQLRAAGKLKNLQEMRAVSRASVELKEYKPKNQ